MLRRFLILVAASASYGFSIGYWHSLDYALRNLIKFPLLILVTTLVCCLAWYFCTLLLSLSLSFKDVQGLAFRIYEGCSVLLLSLTPVNIFLCLVLEQATSRQHLADYPLFQGINIIFIAVSASLALVSQASRLVKKQQFSRQKGIILILIWLALSLPVGGQWAWYLRPFFGISALGTSDSFCHGTAPDFRGDRNFFEAVYHIVRPPRLGER